ncbi:hypothetical protein C3L33_17628, partial [Rhododendron williamsianum]
MTAEIWALRDGLWVAWRFRFPHLIVEADSLLVYNALCRKQVQAGQLKRMLQEVSEFSSMQVTFFYWKANGVADLLAKNAATTHGRSAAMTATSANSQRQYFTNAGYSTLHNSDRCFPWDQNRKRN